MTEHDPAHWLRRSLHGNAWFSGLAGVLLCVAARPIADVLGVEAPWIVRTLGLGLMLHTLWLTMITQRPTPDRREVWAVIGLDTAWVLGSALLLVAGPIPLTLAGKWAIGIVADLVATFAALQFYGLHRQQAGAVPHETR